MASQWHQSAIYSIINGDINLALDTFKIMLVDSTYSDNKDFSVVDNGTADDPASHEISVTGYTPGFGGSGRKTAIITSQVNNTDDRVDFAIADLTWVGLSTGATIGGACLIKEGTNDADSRLICFFDLPDTPTNNGDITLDFLALGSGGNLRFST
jgi:hypothetical protein